MKFIGEIALYLFYDIEEDRLRNKIAETCKDYGLFRIQYSGFFGYLTRSKREELFLRISHILEGQTGKILLQPVCKKDLTTKMELINTEGGG